VRTGRSAHPSLVPFQLFQGADKEWFVVGCAKEKFYQRLAEVVGRLDLATDPRFVDFAARSTNKDELISILDDLFSARAATEWIDALKAAGVPTGPVQDVAAAMQEPHTQARGLIVETDHHRFGPIKSLASPVRVGPPEALAYRRAPTRGEHADEVLRGMLGYDDERIAHLEKEGAFGSSE
jgi:crotonobetainyl-CoA:carnitine CoA-transferase CaiB-like acyl-CoA transferase